MARQRKATRRRLPASKRANAVGRESSRAGSAVPLDVVAMRGPKTDAYGEGLGFPGEPPFTRGIHPTMYRARLWTMRQYAGFGTAKETNRRFKYLFAHGNEGLSGAVELPTQMGDDSGAPMARGEGGRGGGAASTIEGMHTLLRALPPDRGSTSMSIKAAP